MSDVQGLLGEFKKKYKTDIATVGVHVKDPPRLKTGIFAFDLATGGGFPVGRCSVVYGPESSMKTSLCLKAIATAQKEYPDQKAIFVDVEGRFSKYWAASMGVDCDKLVYVLPDSAEQMVDVVEALLYATDVSVIVVDSLAALLTVNEQESDAEKAQVGTTGLLINKFYRKASHALMLARREDHAPTLLLINQIRFKIGVMYGNPETMPGGPSFKFLSSLTIRVYGKDEIDKKVDDVLPAYKHVKFILKKWSVPVVAPNGEFLMALQPIADLNLAIGESYDWNTVLAYLKSLELLQKGKNGWDLIDPGTGEAIEFKKQDDLKQLMVEKEDWNKMVKGWIIDGVLKDD